MEKSDRDMNIDYVVMFIIGMDVDMWILFIILI